MVVVIDGADGIAVLGRESAAADLLQDAAGRARLVAAARLAAARRTAGRELFPSPLPGGFLDATLLPLADGQRVLALLRDLDFEAGLRAGLIESRERYRDLATLAGDFLWETDADGRFVFVSPGGFLGWTPGDLLDRPAAALILAEAGAGDGPAAPGLFSARRPVRAAELWLRRADGGSDCVALSALPLLGRDGDWRGARGLGRVVTDERRSDGALAQTRLRDRLTAHLARIVRDTIDPREVLHSTASLIDFAVGATGGAILRLTGEGEWQEALRWGAEPAADAAGGPPLLRLETRFGGTHNGALLVWRGAGDAGFVAEDHLVLGEAAAQLGAVLARMAQQDAAATLARTDPLTGLLNRRALLEEAERRLKRLRRHPRPVAVAYLDLDNFKLVNDRRGHQAGDEAILAVARLLRQHSRSEDLVARIGGDEFVLWLDGVEGTAAEHRARQLLEAARPLAPLTGDAGRPLGLSIGVAIHDPGCPETLQALLARADRALYAAKHAGKGRWALAAPVASKAAS